MPMKVIIAGAPASGKGTQCEFIRGHFGLVHLSTGDMLRQAVVDRTNTGREAKMYMDRGDLVPDEIIINIVLERLAGDDCVQRGWLLDGFPRTVEQGKALLRAGIKADLLVHSTFFF